MLLSEKAQFHHVFHISAVLTYVDLHRIILSAAGILGLITALLNPYIKLAKHAKLQ